MRFMLCRGAESGGRKIPFNVLMVVMKSSG
jgi:hypothetical protein